MKYEGDELLELLAAEYVVGTLVGAARRRFERLCSVSAPASAARSRWEDRLAVLALQFAPIQPREQVWRGIRDIIAAHTRTPVRARIGRRRWLPLAAAAALVGLAVWLGPRLLTPPSATRVVTVLGADIQHPQWRIERSADARRLKVLTFGAAPANAQQAYELWALPGDGKPPVSLGLLPRQGELARALSDAQSMALLDAEKLAVSIEPPGGSPTGEPTGPVIMVGAVKTS